MREISSIYVRDNSAAMVVLSGEEEGSINVIESWASSPDDNNVLAAAINLQTQWDIALDIRKAKNQKLLQELKKRQYERQQKLNFITSQSQAMDPWRYKQVLKEAQQEAKESEAIDDAEFLRITTKLEKNVLHFFVLNSEPSLPSNEPRSFMKEALNVGGVRTSIDLMPPFPAIAGLTMVQAAQQLNRLNTESFEQWGKFKAEMKTQEKEYSVRFMALAQGIAYLLTNPEYDPSRPLKNVGLKTMSDREAFLWAST